MELKIVWEQDKVPEEELEERPVGALRTSLFWTMDVKEHLDSIHKALFKRWIINPFIHPLESTSGDGWSMLFAMKASIKISNTRYLGFGYRQPQVSILLCFLLVTCI